MADRELSPQVCNTAHAGSEPPVIALPHVPARKFAKVVSALRRQLKADSGSGRPGEGGHADDDDLDAWLRSMNVHAELSEPLRRQLGAKKKSDLTDPSLSDLVSIRR